MGRKSGGASCSNSDTTAWAAQVVTNGGTAIPSSNQTAVCHLVNGLVIDGLYSDVLMLGVIDPTSLIGAFTPVIQGAGSTPWLNNSFVGGDLSANGITCRASSSTSMRTAFALSSWPSAQSLGFFAYIYHRGAVGYTMGASDGGATIYAAFVSEFTDHNSYFYNGAVPGNVITVNPSPGDGYFSDQRVSSTDHRAYWANGSNAHAQIGATDTTSWTGTQSNNPFWIGCGDFIFNGCCNDTISAVGFTNGLSAARDALLFARIQAYLVERGGGFV